MRNSMKRIFLVAGLCTALLSVETAYAERKISEASQQCIDCHSVATPAIVTSWQRSRHASVTPVDALRKKTIERRVSAKQVPEMFAEKVVGCAECHCMNPDSHKDLIDHNDARVHLTVTPNDCRTCHADEADQYQKNIMSHAHGNLANNNVYTAMMASINGVQSMDKGGALSVEPPKPLTNDDSCYSCHGTALKIVGKTVRDSSYGEMEFLNIDGWPNQGVGRVNLDGSKGSCASCHTKHEFSIVMARKPYTCAQCHKGPDVPAYQTYTVSKHGNVFATMHKDWQMDKVPWVAGADFSGPTCAVCHVSLVTSVNGDIIAHRTHQMNDRLPWRIFGLIYAHPHPKSPDTTIIRNKNGQPLPTTLDGQLASEFLISNEEMNERKSRLQKVCSACHTQNWVDGHWARFENSVSEANKMTLTASSLLSKAWQSALADPSNPFDEGVEKLWVEQWLFYANSTRFASAMMGADYGVFANGRWFMSRNVRDMIDRIGSLQLQRFNKGDQ